MTTNILKLQNVNSWLISTDKELKEALYHRLRFREKNYYHNPAYKQKRWDGFRNFFNERTGLFLSGLLPEVLLTLKKLGKPYEILDERENDIKWLHKNIDEHFLTPWLPEDRDPFTLHDYQPDFVNKAMFYNRGLIQAPTACHARGQGVILYSGAVEKVEKIQVGDQLLGPDSTPRTVLHLHRGEDDLYKVIPHRGKSFVVNGDHVLSLVRTPNNRNRYPSEIGGQIVNVTVREWIKWSNWKKHLHKLYHAELVTFPNRPAPKIDPYFLGILLGDGGIQTTSNQAGGKSITYYLSQGLEKKKTPNPLAEALREVDLWGMSCHNKFIPQSYKLGSPEVRLAVLAGLIDTDGHSSGTGIDFNLKSERLARDVAFVARSLGFFVSEVKPTLKSSQSGVVGTYYRFYISGDFSQVPLRVKTVDVKTRKNPLKVGFRLEFIGKGEFFGFELDGDHLYLLDDFLVTHNSGKTFIMISLLKCLPPNTPVLFLTKGSGLVHQNYEDMIRWGIPNVGRYYGGYKSPNFITCANTHTQTMKGLEKLIPKFKVLLVDEIHECMSDVPISAYRKMKKACVRFGISATPFKSIKKDKVHKFNVKGHFGPRLLTSTTEDGLLKTSDLQKRGILSPSHCTFYPIDQPNLAYEPYIDAVTLGIAENYHFHQIIRKLARSLKGRTLILVERRDQGEYLKQLIPEAHWINGSDSIESRQPVIQALKTSEQVTAIVMRHIITSGIDIMIHNLINAAGGDADYNVVQQIGRGLRRADDKAILKYYDFIFKINEYLYKHSNNRVQVLIDQGHEVVVKDELDF